MDVANNLKVSIVIRSKNEEDWIGHCLAAVFRQAYENYEVIIVDNQSSDKTLNIVKQYPVTHIVNIERYLPGYAINEGVKISSGDIIVMLSSHCIPSDKNWLSNLLANFSDPNVAGVYGRQLPVSFSSPSDVRDLFITFGLDKRVQVRDYFFHNANSAIRKDIWHDYPFDDDTTNIEDRIWGKTITGAGYYLVYEPAAKVFHHHGIHQNQSDGRARSTLQVLKEVESFNHKEWLPDSLRPENREIIAIIPLKTDLERIVDYCPVKSLFDELFNTTYLKHIFFISSEKVLASYELGEKITLLERPDALYEKNISLGEVLKWGLQQVNDRDLYPDYVIYANPDYVFRPNGIIKRLIEDACFKGLDSVFMGYEEYSNYWSYEKNDDDYRPFGQNLLPRSDKNPLYKSLFGLGCISRSRIIRQGKIVGSKKIGIISTTDIKYSLRVTDTNMRRIIETLLK